MSGIARIPSTQYEYFTISAKASDKKSGAMIIAVDPDYAGSTLYVAVYNGTKWLSITLGGMALDIDVQEVSVTSEEITYKVSCQYSDTASPTKATFIPPPSSN